MVASDGRSTMTRQQCIDGFRKAAWHSKRWMNWSPGAASQFDLQPLSHHLGLPKIAFPDDDRRPSQGLHVGLTLKVSNPIALQLRLPELATGGGHYGKSTVRMLMPEAAVNPDSDSASRHGDIGRTWEPPVLEAVSIPHLGENPSKGALWLGVSAANARHHVAAFRGGHDVSAHE